MRRFICSAVALGAPQPAFASSLADGTSMLHMVWVAVCAGLVLLMQPGFAFLESGLARAKNAVNVLMKNFTDCAIASVGYWTIGFGLMFGVNSTGWFGFSGFMPSEGTGLVNVLYQTFFAATTATIISGAVAERMRYLPYLIGTLAVVVLIYPLSGSWIWGGTPEAPGWLRGLGFVDAAGGVGVHAVGGFIALAAVIVLGPRFGRFGRDGGVRQIPGHSLPLAALGAFLLWIGWLGFNGGATEQDFSDLGRIVLNTHLAASTGIIGAILLQVLRGRPVLATQVLNGALGGLVGITAGAKSVEPSSAAVIGLGAGVIVVLGSALLHRLRIDDVVDAFPVHGLCGVYGAIMAGALFAGDLFNPERVLTQAIGAFAVAAWAFGAGWFVFKSIDLMIGLRAPTEHEQSGLDYTEHHELGYPEFMTARTHRAVEDAAPARATAK
ncbi:MAG: ammonium transporter [Xanthomonadaceae bacterium]|jgi:Amt family ammonium transporter|nr:ammonium transporter [Xanthomonadaceae bacterium]